MNLEQLRARNAFQAAARAAEGDPAEFLSLARSLPQMLQTNGLLAAWAFLLAKDKSGQPHGAVLQAFVAHFQDRSLVDAATSGAGDLLLSEWAGLTKHLPTGDLQRLTTEAIAFAGWLKRAAEALCDRGGTAR